MMSDTKLDPRSLTSEERAIVDLIANNCATGTAGSGGWGGYYDKAWELAKPAILARRALFGSPASEPAKVECPNCRQKVGPGWDHEVHDEQFTCQPAQPEPVAAEMPDLQDALNDLWNAMGVPRLDVREISVSEAIIRKAIEAISTHAAQPAKARMTEELEELLRWARDAAGNVGSLPYPSAQEDEKRIRMMIDKVRAQAAEAGKVRMPKVRELLDHLDTEIGFSNKIDVLTQAAFAELDAAEGRHP